MRVATLRLKEPMDSVEPFNKTAMTQVDWDIDADMTSRTFKVVLRRTSVARYVPFELAKCWTPSEEDAPFGTDDVVISKSPTAGDNYHFEVLVPPGPTGLSAWIPAAQTFAGDAAAVEAPADKPDASMVADGLSAVLCPICGFPAKNKSGMAAHTRSKHT